MISCGEVILADYVAMAGFLGLLREPDVMYMADSRFRFEIGNLWCLRDGGQVEQCLKAS